MDAARIAGDRHWAVVVEPEVHVFSSYWWHQLEANGGSAPPMVLSPRAPEPWMGVRRPWLVATVHPPLYLPSLTGESRLVDLYRASRRASQLVVSHKAQPITSS